MEELVAKAKAGDKSAYTELIKMLKFDLYKIANARLNNIEDINDAIHETLLKSFKNLKKLKHNENFKTWIIKILINECNNIYISNSRQIKIFNKIIDLKNFKISEDYSIQKIESKLSFEELIKSLNYDEKIVVVLYYTNNYTTGEIAEVLNISVNTVKSRLRRAKEKIKNDCKGGIFYEESKQ